MLMLRPEANAPNKFMETENIPVTTPTFPGNTFFIYAGVVTFPMHIPNPKRNEPRYSIATFPDTRKYNPVIRTISENIIP